MDNVPAVRPPSQLDSNRSGYPKAFPWLRESNKAQLGQPGALGGPYVPNHVQDMWKEGGIYTKPP